MTAHRTTRQAALVRFRNERLAARAPDARARQDAFLKVVDEVNQISMAAQDELAGIASDRAEMSRDLHGMLDAQRKDLADAMADHIGTLKSQRSEFAKDLHNQLDSEFAAFSAELQAWLKSTMSDRAEMSRDLHGMLDSFYSGLAGDLRSMLSETSTTRREDRDRDFADRRQEVDDIRFSDFGVSGVVGQSAFTEDFSEPDDESDAA